MHYPMGIDLNYLYSFLDACSTIHDYGSIFVDKLNYSKLYRIWSKSKVSLILRPTTGIVSSGLVLTLLAWKAQNCN